MSVIQLHKSLQDVVGTPSPKPNIAVCKHVMAKVHMSC